jgi:hypothetical protein
MKGNEMGDNYLKVPAGEPIPLSQLALDLPCPPDGWPAYLGARGIAIVPDDLGRDSVSRQAARRLLDEHREQEVRAAALARLAEQQAIERDQAFRAQLWQGAPADAIPPGVAPAAAMLQAHRDSQPRRQSVLQEALQHSEGLTYHSFAPTSGDEL